MKNHVKLTQNYAIKTDAHNFIVLQRKLVDPTKAPGYKPVEGAELPALKERWDEIAYYPLTSANLAALIDNVRLREATDSEYASIADLAQAIRETTAEIIAAVNAGLAPGFSVNIGA
ncbi:hypothetical protein [Paenibacillus sp. ACRRY]|uniref:hypothetical protein n=1 Tax=Paenibacillus sp. ACRRY TaxID=2918208 RepID=UPI001EF52E2F|nr:hypothetical protein [Paenibacillus sp. ACRRY]MCG7383335.1 hypothetical protein [Paenibacillus sp. ACRRY]